MLQDLYTYSTQPYMVVWSLLFVIFGIFTIISIISGFDIDLDMDGEVDIDLDGSVGGDFSGGFFRAFCVFVNVGHVPVTLIIFSIVTVNWVLGIYLNQNFNSNHNILLGIGMAVGSLIVSIPVSKVITTPVKALFKRLNEDQHSLNKSVGSICTLETDVNDSQGRAVIKTEASPLNIMVKCEEGKTISKGSKAVVIEFDKNSNRYLVAEIEDDIFSN